VATGGLAGDIGSVLAGVRIECIGWWDANERVFTSWRWHSPNQKVNGWLPK